MLYEVITEERGRIGGPVEDVVPGVVAEVVLERSGRSRAVHGAAPVRPGIVRTAPPQFIA